MRDSDGKEAETKNEEGVKKLHDYPQKREGKSASFLIATARPLFCASQYLIRRCAREIATVEDVQALARHPGHDQ
jgi:hypothetical protein